MDCYVCPRLLGILHVGVPYMYTHMTYIVHTLHDHVGKLSLPNNPCQKILFIELRDALAKWCWVSNKDAALMMVILYCIDITEGK